MKCIEEISVANKSKLATKMKTPVPVKTLPTKMNCLHFRFENVLSLQSILTYANLKIDFIEIT